MNFESHSDELAFFYLSLLRLQRPLSADLSHSSDAWLTATVNFSSDSNSFGSNESEEKKLVSRLV